jgi:hypothetical protein
MTLRFRRNRSTATTSQRAAIRLYLRKARLFRGASRAYERDYLDAAAALGRYSPAELIGFARQLDPVGFQNSAAGPDLRFYPARSYSLMRPPRTGRRWIRSWRGPRRGGRAGAGGDGGCDGVGARCNGPRTGPGSSAGAVRRR